MRASRNLLRRLTQISASATVAACQLPVGAITHSELEEIAAYPVCNVRTSDFEVEINPDITISGEINSSANASSGITVLLLHGSGPHDRDQSVSGSPMFEMISDYLVQFGIQVVRFDRRGQGRSTGNPNEEMHTTLDSAEDAIQLIESLRDRGLISRERLVLFGHSEGAMTASIMAARDPGIAMVVYASPPGLSGEDTWIEQLVSNLVRRGASAEVAQNVRGVLVEYSEYLRTGDLRSDDPTYQAIGRRFLLAHGMSEQDVTDEFADNLIGGFKVPWYRYFLSHDIVLDIERMDQPVAAIFAADDQQVPPGKHATRLIDALMSRSDIQFATHFLPDEDHFFLRHDGDRVDKHVFGEMRMSQEFLSVLALSLKVRFPELGKRCGLPEEL